MVAVSVSAKNTRLDEADVDTDWIALGGGPGIGVETDFFYEDSACISRRAQTSLRGLALADTVQTNLLSSTGTYQHVIFKSICTTPGLLLDTSDAGLRMLIGNDSTNYYEYVIAGADTYPLQASWLIRPISPNVPGYRDGTTGSPLTSTADFYGMQFQVSGQSQVQNVGMDAVDVGAGLLIEYGTSNDTPCVWQDFVDFDEGTGENRFGYATTFNEILFIYGTLEIGTSTDATEFADTAETLVFPNGLFEAGFSGLEINLHDSSTSVAWTDCNFFSRGADSDTTGGRDTRAVLTVNADAAPNGTLTATGCVFDAFADMTLTSECTLTECTMSAGLLLTQNNALLDGCVISGAATSDGGAYIHANNLNRIQNCEFTFSDGHAIQLDSSGDYTLDGCTFTGYGDTSTNDAAIFNNSGAPVIISITGGVSSPTHRNSVGSTTTITNDVTLTVTVKDENGIAIVGAQTAIYSSDNVQLMNEDTIAGGVATESFNFTSEINVSVRVRKGSTSDATRYVPVYSNQVITGDGLNVTITLSVDAINNA